MTCASLVITDASFYREVHIDLWTQDRSVSVEASQTDAAAVALIHVSLLIKSRPGRQSDKARRHTHTDSGRLPPPRSTLHRSLSITRYRPNLIEITTPCGIAFRRHLSQSKINYSRSIIKCYVRSKWNDPAIISHVYTTRILYSYFPFSIKTPRTKHLGRNTLFANP